MDFPESRPGASHGCPVIGSTRDGIGAWQSVPGFFRVTGVLGLLRFVGVMNAAIWFGGLVFFTLAVGPAFFTPQMLDVFGGRDHPYARAWAGQSAQVVLVRYFLMQQICAAVAMIHLLGEWLYTGRRPRRFIGTLLGAALAVVLLGGWWLQPKLSALHVIRYGTRSTAEQRVEAARSFRLWHGVSQVMNLLLLAGVGVYFWRTINPAEDLRFVGSSKSIRGV